MARFINGRLLPTFLPALAIEEMKPSWEMIMKEFDKTHKRTTHSLQRLEDSLARQSTSENKKEILGDEFGLECGEPIVIDQPTNEEHEVEILEPAKRINLEACDVEHTSWKEEGHTIVFQRSSLQEYLDKACSTLSLNLHNGEEVWYKGEGAKFSR